MKFSKIQSRKKRKKERKNREKRKKASKRKHKKAYVRANISELKSVSCVSKQGGRGR